MADRDQALAEFQAITGYENIQDCIVVLEQHDWNLMEAVQNALAGTDPDPVPLSNPDVQFPPSAFRLMGMDSLEPSGRLAGAFAPLNEGIVGESIRSLSSHTAVGVSFPPTGSSVAASVPSAAAASASSSAFQPYSSVAVPQSDAQATRLLRFHVEYRDRTIELSVFDNEKVGKLKEYLAVEIGVESSKQELCGWVNKNDKRITDEDKLCDLRLPKENTLFLLTPDLSVASGSAKANNGEESSLFERLSQTFTLRIRHKEKDRTYSLNYPGSKTIQEVKGDVYSMTDIPVSRQIWEGWPQSVDDDTMTLAGSGVGFPCHVLEVSVAKSRKTAHKTEDDKRSDEDMELDSEEDFEDASEQFSMEDNFLEPEVTGPRKPEPLMPENASNESEALTKFSAEFSARFGDCHPVFYIGSLENALRDSLQCRARDRKLLAIYLHHDGSILSNVFCSQILCAESVVSYLANNFTVWAWDLTSDLNHARLLAMCSRHFGTLAATTVRSIKSDELPLLLLISRSRGSNEVVNAIRGNTNLDELMSQLLHAHEDFKQQQQTDVLEENEREARESVKREQDHAYQESLAADKAKDEAKKLEDDEKDKKLKDDAKKQEHEAHTRQLEDETKEALRQSVASQLPDEPQASCTEPVATIRVRCPDGRTLVRRFLAQNPLQTLLNYIVTEGFHISEHKVLTTFPRRDLTQMDTQASLQSLKLFPQETVILELI